MNRTQNDVPVTASSDQASVATAKVILTDVAEDVAEGVDAVPPEVSARRTGADVTATLTATARTRVASAKHAPKATRKTQLFQT